MTGATRYADKRHDRVLAVARQIRRETGQAPDPRLQPPLILTPGDKL